MIAIHQRDHRRADNPHHFEAFSDRIQITIP
jgi:hypothetical protein